MEIRRVIDGDIEELAKLYKQFWGTESCVDKMRAKLPKIDQNPSYIILVAVEEGNVIGTVMGIVCDELYGDCKPFLVIEDVIVGKDNRRNGVGTALMRELEVYAAKSCCKYAILVTELERTEAHKFYESLDYHMEPYKGFKKQL